MEIFQPNIENPSKKVKKDCFGWCSKNSKEIYMPAPEGFEKYNPKKNSWSQITKPMYKFKKTGLYCHRNVKRAMQANGLE